MKIRLRIARPGFGPGKTLFLDVEKYPTSAEVMDWVRENHPGWSVVGWCEACIIEQAVINWVKQYGHPDLMDVVKILGSLVLVNDVPFASVTIEGEDSVVMRFYNYNFKWGVNNGSIKIDHHRTKLHSDGHGQSSARRGTIAQGRAATHRTRGDCKNIF